MSRIVAIISFCIFWVHVSYAQLTGITPNQSVINQYLSTTITGNNIFIQSSSPAGNLYKIQLTNGTDIITIFDYNLSWTFFSANVIDPNTVIADLTIPPAATPGVYELQVVTGDVQFPWWNQNQYILPGAFTVLPPDGYITGTTYRDLNKNGIKDPGEPGIASQIKLLPSNTVLTTDANGYYSIPAVNGNYSIVYINNIYDWHYVTSGSDTIPVIINNGNSDNNDYGLGEVLSSVNPDSAYAGIPSNHIFVSDKPIFNPGLNPYGNITQVYLYSSPGYSIPVTTNVSIIDSFTVQVTMNIPAGTAAMDSLDIWFSVSGAYYGYHHMWKKFKINPPDGYITGNVFYDINLNGIKDPGEPGLYSNPVRLMPGNFIVYTNSIGDYSIGVQNGNYTVSPLQATGNNMFPVTVDSISVTVNNNNVSGNDFGMKPALYSVTPEAGFRGLTSAHTFVADKPIFVPGVNPNGNITYVRVASSPSIYPLVNSAVNVVDSFTVVVTISIPIGTSLANNIDVYFYTNTGPYTGYHYLKQQFDIINPLPIVSGKAFFDQNQNKLFDAGEPGIVGAKFSLFPDSSYSFSDYAGNFEAASYGGVQTLTYTNNLPGLILFTDSASYTFNLNGAITGKNFGFVTTNPDYSVDVSYLSIFPRCNSQQNASVWIRNISNISYSLQVSMAYSPNLAVVSTYPAASSISNNTIYWTIPNLSPYTSMYLNALFNMPTGGQLGNLSVQATSLDTSGAIQLTDTMSSVFTIVCSYDPNDKNVTPPGVSTEHFTLMSDTLLYKIRFQNTGNDTALKVVILDTLDSNLDFETFEVLESSHSMKTQLNKDGSVKFTFNDIMLPDSNVNEAASHGYLLYRINAESGLDDSTEVYNTGHIYFDYNPDIITNTTLNTLVYTIPSVDPLPVELVSFTGTAKEKYNELKWITLSEVNNDRFELERAGSDLKFVYVASIDGNGTTGSVSEYYYNDYGISDGEEFYYRLKQVDYDGHYKYSNIIIVKRVPVETDQFVTVFPNPFRNNFKLKFTDDTNNIFKLEILDMSGKIMYDESVFPGSNVYELELPDNILQKGMYLLHVTSDSQKLIVKLIKN